MAELTSKTGAERHLYQHPDRTWGWRLRVNGRIVATDHGQGYENEQECRQMADRVVGGFYADADKTITRQKEK